MKLKLDENLPASAAPRLAALGHDVHTVLDESLGGRHDGVIWSAAQAEGRMLVTCALDFSDARTFAPGTHSRISLVRLPDAGHRLAWISDHVDDPRRLSQRPHRVVRKEPA